jgi:hypothetical protein
MKEVTVDDKGDYYKIFMRIVQILINSEVLVDLQNNESPDTYLRLLQ